MRFCVCVEVLADTYNWHVTHRKSCKPEAVGLVFHVGLCFDTLFHIMTSQRADNSYDFLNELLVEKPNSIKLQIEKQKIKINKRALKKSVEVLEQRIRKLTSEHKAMKMRIYLADCQLQYLQTQIDGPVETRTLPMDQRLPTGPAMSMDQRLPMPMPMGPMPMDQQIPEPPMPMNQTMHHLWRYILLII